LKGLRVADLAGEREGGIGVFRRDFPGAVLHLLEAGGHGIFGHRLHPGVHGFAREIHELHISGMRLSQILFGRLTQGLRDFEWAVGHHFSPGLNQAALIGSD